MFIVVVVQYMQGPMLDALYPEQWYNDQNYTSDELGYILHENRLLGAARLRQVIIIGLIMMIAIVQCKINSPQMR